MECGHERGSLPPTRVLPLGGNLMFIWEDRKKVETWQTIRFKIQCLYRGPVSCSQSEAEFPPPRARARERERERERERRAAGQTADREAQRLRCSERIHAARARAAVRRNHAPLRSLRTAGGTGCQKEWEPEKT
ncbi:hypothetical protein GN956_G14822 [Arapaima gigas]